MCITDWQGQFGLARSGTGAPDDRFRFLALASHDMRALILQSNRLYGQLMGELVREMCLPVEVVVCDRARVALKMMRIAPVALALVGVDVPDVDGMDFIPRIIISKLSLQTIILTERTDNRTLSALRRLNYEGFVDATSAGCEELRTALRCVMDGKRYTSMSLVARNSEPGLPKQHCLSLHEEAILSLLGEGLDDEDAANQLQLAPRTVESHRCRIMRKLNLHHKGELIDYALANLYVRRSSEGTLHPGFESILGKMKCDEHSVGEFDWVGSQTVEDIALALHPDCGPRSSNTARRINNAKTENGIYVILRNHRSGNLLGAPPFPLVLRGPETSAVP